MKTKAQCVMGAWMRVPLTHPMTKEFAQLRAPNPRYHMAVKSGRGVPEDVTPYDYLCIEQDSHLLVPRAHAERAIVGWEDARANVPVNFPAFRQELDSGPYRGQAEWVTNILANLNTRSGIIAEAQTGFGKTVCVNRVIFHIGQRTLVLVHTEFLMRQWADRLVDAGLKESQIGFIQQSKAEYGGKYLVSIAMIQTLLARQEWYPKSFFASFGLVVADEVHNMGATTFRETITMFNPKYRLGVSATPNRKDGADLVFQSHIGPVAVWGRKRKLKPRVKGLIQQHDLGDGIRVLQSYRRDERTQQYRMMDDLVKVETYLVNHQHRNQRLVRLMTQAVLKGRKTLVLTARLQHLDHLRTETHRALRQVGRRDEVGVFKGQMKAAAWAVSAGCPCIVGTFAIAKEALDLPALDTLILATPRSDIIQSVGRILRDVKGKKTPIVVDIVDRGIGLCEGLARRRWRQYQSMGWTTEDVPGELRTASYHRRVG